MTIVIYQLVLLLIINFALSNIKRITLWDKKNKIIAT